MREDVDFSTCFSSRLKGRARAIVHLETLEGARVFMRKFSREREGWVVLGKGSNVIPTGLEFSATLVVLEGDFKALVADWETGVVTAGAAVPLPLLARLACRNGWAGLEQLGGIPGTVAGGVVMNAGVGEEGAVAFGPLVEEVALLDPEGNERWEKLDHSALGYRSSPYSHRSDLISRVKLRFPQRVRAEQLLQIYDEGRRWRRQRQPLNMPNWGSTFVNPPGLYAGRLIDQCGLKGTRIGDIEVSPLQANFFVNHGSGTGPDAVQLIDFVSRTVYEQTGIQLQREVRYLEELTVRSSI